MFNRVAGIVQHRIAAGNVKSGRDNRVEGRHQAEIDRVRIRDRDVGQFPRYFAELNVDIAACRQRTVADRNRNTGLDLVAVKIDDPVAQIQIQRRDRLALVVELIQRL